MKLKKGVAGRKMRVHLIIRLAFWFHIYTVDSCYKITTLTLCSDFSTALASSCQFLTVASIIIISGRRFPANVNFNESSVLDPMDLMRSPTPSGPAANLLNESKFF